MFKSKKKKHYTDMTTEELVDHIYDLSTRYHNIESHCPSLGSVNRYLILLGNELDLRNKGVQFQSLLDCAIDKYVDIKEDK